MCGLWLWPGPWRPWGLLGLSGDGGAPNWPFRTAMDLSVLRKFKWANDFAACGFADYLKLNSHGLQRRRRD